MANKRSLKQNAKIRTAEWDLAQQPSVEILTRSGFQDLSGERWYAVRCKKADLVIPGNFHALTKPPAPGGV